MKDFDLNKQFEALKRQTTDLVRELHARKLAIPAGALLLAIVAAVVLLPQSTTPPPAPPTAATPTIQPKVARVAQVSLIEPSTLGEDIPITSSTDPFIGTTGYSCTKVGSNPDMYDCEVSDLKVRIICTDESSTGPCAEKAGATGGGGSGSSTSTGSGTNGTEGNTDTGGDDGGSDVPEDVTETYYLVTVSIDGKTTKDVEAGDDLPSSKNRLVVYAGTNDAHDKAVFLAADGVTVDGAEVDPTFGSFEMKKNQTVTLTDSSAKEHKLTLKSITKVTK